MVSCTGKVCLLAILVIVIASNASATTNLERIMEKLKILTTFKEKLEELKRSGAVSFRCKNDECEVCFKNQDHNICNKVTHNVKMGKFTFEISIDGVAVPLPVIGDGMKGLVCPKDKRLSSICARLKDVKAGTLNANICYAVHLAGRQLFDACVERSNGRKLSVKV
ncbi:hypothetical protein AAG570_009429 [Ranatra chinensis]|uniref:Uncharacterized protein n=1 Tax=Ranatra chinensis TaxID=642074 RepID=A0ABD0YP23_9HEMI